jgi:hypothetical protein
MQPVMAIAPVFMAGNLTATPQEIKCFARAMLTGPLP